MTRAPGLHRKREMHERSQSQDMLRNKTKLLNYKKIVSLPGRPRRLAHFSCLNMKRCLKRIDAQNLIATGEKSAPLAGPSYCKAWLVADIPVPMLYRLSFRYSVARLIPSMRPASALSPLTC